jgi:hypothetical protein
LGTKDRARGGTQANDGVFPQEIAKWMIFLRHFIRRHSGFRSKNDHPPSFGCAPRHLVFRHAGVRFTG